jgi:DNA-binding CsgD family transcriptional regulator
MDDVATWLHRSSASLNTGATLRAIDQAQAAFALAQGDQRLELATLEALGTAMWARGEVHHAALVLGARRRLQQSTGLAGVSDLDHLAEHSPGWETGQTMSPRQVLDWLADGRDRRGNPTTGWAALTPSERQVVELAVEGLSNPRIAQKLFLSTNTVKTHLQRAYRKLGITSRGELSQARR